jgi:sugar phosphate isomerase/epimerase
MNRRHFLGLGAGTAGLLAIGSLQAVEPFLRKGPAHLRLSLAAYGFRDQFKPGKEGTPARMDMYRFLDFCAEQRCDGAELTSYYFEDKITDAELLRIRRHAHLRGMTISGTAVGNDFCLPEGPKRAETIASVKEWIRKAALIGAPHIRVFAGTVRDTTEPEAIALAIAALEECGEVAGRAGIFLGIENHGGVVRKTENLIEIVKAVKNPWVGINLDTGNFYSEDPYRELALCAPWAVNVQFKGKVHPAGKKQEKADYAKTFQILKDSGYQGFVALEYEFPGDPFSEIPAILGEMRPFMG